MTEPSRDSLEIHGAVETRSLWLVPGTSGWKHRKRLWTQRLLDTAVVVQLPLGRCPESEHEVHCLSSAWFVPTKMRQLFTTWERSAFQMNHPRIWSQHLLTILSLIYTYIYIYSVYKLICQSQWPWCCLFPFQSIYFRIFQAIPLLHLFTCRCYGHLWAIPTTKGWPMTKLLSGQEFAQLFWMFVFQFLQLLRWISHFFLPIHAIIPGTHSPIDAHVYLRMVLNPTMDRWHSIMECGTRNATDEGQTPTWLHPSKSTVAMLYKELEICREFGHC